MDCWYRSIRRARSRSRRRSRNARFRSTAWGGWKPRGRGRSFGLAGRARRQRRRLRWCSEPRNSARFASNSGVASRRRAARAPARRPRGGGTPRGRSRAPARAPRSRGACARRGRRATLRRSLATEKAPGRPAARTPRRRDCRSGTPTIPRLERAMDRPQDRRYQLAPLPFVGIVVWLGMVEVDLGQAPGRAALRDELRRVAPRELQLVSPRWPARRLARRTACGTSSMPRWSTPRRARAEAIR